MKRASFEFIGFTAALVAGITTGHGLAQIELATTKPGPHALFASGAMPMPTVSTYIWQGDTQAIQLSTSWQTIALPIKTGKPEPAVLRLTAPEKSPAAPRMFLYSQGDPIHIISSNGHSYFKGYAPETPTVSTESMPLPVLSGADIMILHGQQVIGVFAWETLLTKKETETGISISRATNGTYQLESAAANTPSPKSITLRPLYRRRTVHPVQSGIYLFETYDHEYNLTQSTGRRLKAGAPTEIELDDGGYTGACLRFLPDRFSYSSNMENDHIIRFDGFHSREKTSDSRSPFARWTSRPDARIHLVHPPGTDLTVTLRFRANRPESIPLDSIVLAAENAQYVLDMQTGEGSVTMRVPAQSNETTPITISTDTWIPATVIAGGDNRNLGVMLTGLRVAFQVPDSTNASPAR